MVKNLKKNLLSILVPNMQFLNRDICIRVNFRSLKISGKEIIVPSNTFIASVNAILNSGCKPIFADCGEDMCIDIKV